MHAKEEHLITYWLGLAECLRPYDKKWSDFLAQAAVEAKALFQSDAGVSSKFDFVSRHNYSTGGMGSLNDGIVPEICELHQRNLCKAINDLLREYWKELGREWHDYSTFDLIPESAQVRLVPGKIVFCNSVYSTEVPNAEDCAEDTWVVLRCNGPDMTNMPSYTIRRVNTFRSARHEALEIVDRRATRRSGRGASEGE